jgi:hypothetical protein
MAAAKAVLALAAPVPTADAVALTPTEWREEPNATAVNVAASDPEIVARGRLPACVGVLVADDLPAALASIKSTWPPDIQVRQAAASAATRRTAESGR